MAPFLIARPVTTWPQTQRADTPYNEADGIAVAGITAAVKLGFDEL